MVKINHASLIDGIIKISLEQIGMLTNADRSFLIEFFTRPDEISNSYQWCSQNIEPSSMAFQKSSVDPKSWLYGKLQQKSIITINSINDLPHTDNTYRRELEADRVKSFLALPLWVNSQLIGLVGTEKVIKGKPWSEENKESIKFIINILIGTLQNRSLERELLESEERYRTLVEHSPFAIGVHQRGRIAFVNPTCVKILKAENASQLIGRTTISIVHPDYREFAASRIQEMAETGKGVGLAVEKFICFNGDVIDVEVISNPVMFEGELAFQVVFRDITEERQYAEKLEQSEKKFRTLFEDSIDAIYISSTEGRLIEVNQSFLDLFGYTQMEIEKLNAKEMYVNLDDRLKFQEQMASQGSVKSFEVALKRKDGKILHCLNSASLRKASTGEIIGYQGIIRDVTDDIKAKEALLKTQKLESLGILAGGVAHDFNNLLMGVMGNASAAKDYLEEGSPLYELVEDINKTSQKAANLTRQLLAYSGKGKFLLESVNISDLVSNMKDILRVSVHKTIDLRFVLTEQLPEVIADKTQIEQVILNLVTNASESIGEAVGTIIIKTGKKYLDNQDAENFYFSEDFQPGQYAYILVEDTGMGMDEETKKRIFDPFYTTKFQGRGLGLAALLGIIRTHNGYVAVESELGKGACFNIFLPLDEPEPVQKSNDIDSDEETWRGSGCILLCDDDGMVRAVAKRLLELLGFEVLIAKNGLEAVDLVKNSSSQIDLVILDVTMPKMSGKEAYRAIKAETPDLPILLSSGYSEELAIDKLGSHKLEGFLQKPYTLEILSKKIKKILSK